MTITEIKQTAVKNALVNAIYNAHSTQVKIVENLLTMNDWNRKRYEEKFYADFRHEQQLIDEAFKELFVVKPAPTLS